MKKPSFWASVIALIPFCAICFSVAIWDRIYPMVLGLPFNVFWLLSWIVLTSVCLWGVYCIESPQENRRAGTSRKRPT